jgi:LysB family phage lysis regulatory protein
MSMLKGIALAGVIALVGMLMVGIQQYRIQTMRAEAVAFDAQVKAERKAKDEAVDANLVSQATISTLQAELERNRQYAADLDKRIKASEAKAKQARTDYEKLKRNSKPVRDWAPQPLPDGLRGKPASATGGDKDDGSKARGAGAGAVRARVGS